MWKVRFGNHEGWVQGIASTVDRARFDCQYGDLAEVDITNFDCVVPLALSDYDALQNKIDFAGKKFWCPNPRVVDTCDDKLALNRFLLACNFSEFVPPLRSSGTNEFPYILKKRRDAFGVNSFVVRNCEDERALASILHSPEYYCQAYISGTEEYALHMLMVEGEAAYAQTVKYEFGQTYYIKGKDVMKKARRTYLPDNEHIEIFLRMLTTLGYSGTCCVNYKMDRGVPKLLEINPRFGASLIDDINRYLEAYLNSLGARAEIGLQNCDVSRASHHSPGSTPMRRAKLWVLSQMPYRIWHLLRATRDIVMATLTRLSGLMRLGQRRH